MKNEIYTIIRRIIYWNKISTYDTVLDKIKVKKKGRRSASSFERYTDLGIHINVCSVLR